MDISEACEVLQKYYNQTELDYFYRKKGLAGSEYDTNRKLEYNAELLRKKAMAVSDSNERVRLYAAANEFERIAREAESQR